MKLKYLLLLPAALGSSLSHIDVMADRLYPSDLTYLGAFLVPQTDAYAGMAAIDGPSSLSYRPDGDPTGNGDGFPGSLFLSNHDFVAEIKIPAPVKSTNFSSLNTAQQIQATSGIAVNSGANDRFGAVAYMPAKGAQTSAKLYWSSFEYYNVAGRDYPCIGWSEINLAAANSKGSWHVGPPASDWNSPYHGMKCGDYLIPIDQAWADQYTGGKSLLVGRYREAGAAGGSMGPVLTAIAPWKDGNPPANGSNLSALPLMSFNSISSSSGTNWMEFRLLNDPDYTYYSAGDHWHGGAWVARGNKKAIILVGRHATYSGAPLCPAGQAGGGCGGGVGTNTPPYCYGDGGMDCPWGIAVTNSHGYHTGPYRPRFIFIDPDDLALVAQGSRTPTSIDAYYSFDPSVSWPWADSDNYNDVAGAAYDSVNGYFYVAQANAYRPGGGSNTPWPVIHVYKVNDSGAGSAPVMNAPSNLKIVQ
jgi:hypothetical protein